MASHANYKQNIFAYQYQTFFLHKFVFLWRNISVDSCFCCCVCVFNRMDFQFDSSSAVFFLLTIWLSPLPNKYVQQLPEKHFLNILAEPNRWTWSKRATNSSLLLHQHWRRWQKTNALKRKTIETQWIGIYPIEAVAIEKVEWDWNLCVRQFKQFIRKQRDIIAICILYFCVRQVELAMGIMVHRTLNQATDIPLNSWGKNNVVINKYLGNNKRNNIPNEFVRINYYY